ncbi:MAG TPA: M67 family metallopeptidase [Myxococcaceae bacterium]|nr:M67 family metallopeptidase [Myxococcaceae bacterium]
MREDQIERYSRTILLQPVGGRGQEALLGTGARLAGGGPALLTAAAYLAAGGTPVAVDGAQVAPGELGFLSGARGAGEPAGPSLVDVLQALNPDAAAEPRDWGCLLTLPATRATGARPQVTIGARGDASLVWGADARACAACLGAWLGSAGPAPAGAAAVEAGALAALLFQRLVLGLGPALSAVALDPGGMVQELSAPRCPHRPGFLLPALPAALRHLEDCHPEEGCGVILEGPEGVRWVPLANAYARWAARDPSGFPRSPRSAFLFEPVDWLALLRAADARGEHVCCVVHSHPDGSSGFSAEDRAQAAPGGSPLLPGASHLVVSVQAGRAESANWVSWDGSAFVEAPFSLSGRPS